MLNGTNRKINVGFAPVDSGEWTGGLNYFKNLFSAIKINQESLVNPILVLNPFNDNSQIINMYSDFVTIIESKSIFYDKSIINKLNRKTLRMFKKSFFYDLYFRSKGINVISHSEFCDPASDLKKINWIPDFQHVHLPEMFSEEEIALRDNHYKNLALESDIIVFSSNNALNDFKTFAPEYSSKGRLLPFVSVQNPDIYNEKEGMKQNIQKKYGISEKFFYMPNQFWKHKNHKVVFEAVKILKSRGFNIQVVFTGHLNDYRNNDHIQELLDFINQNSLEENIKVLGLIEYEEVPLLIRNCVSLINSSLFEGWNTMVEEAKSIGKNMILSDLAVHREQNPPECVFFDPYNPEELAGILKEKWRNSEGGPDYELEMQAKEVLKSRIIEFAKTYEKYVLELSRKG